MNQQLIASVRAGDLGAVKAWLEGGGDVHARDEHGWSALAWAAGAGQAAVVALLLERGADARETGHDGRTPYQIALAAGRREAARILAEAEAAQGGGAPQATLRPYCRAYPSGELRRFPGWSGTEAPGAGSPEADATADPRVVFLHRDLSVTRTIWPGEQLVFHSTSDEWRRFCAEALQFEPPNDVDPIAPAAAER